MSCVLR